MAFSATFPTFSRLTVVVQQQYTARHVAPPPTRHNKNEIQFSRFGRRRKRTNLAFFVCLRRRSSVFFFLFAAPLLAFRRRRCSPRICLLYNPPLSSFGLFVRSLGKYPFYFLSLSASLFRSPFTSAASLLCKRKVFPSLLPNSNNPSL